MSRKLMFYLVGIAVGTVIYRMYFKTEVTSATTQPVQVSKALPDPLKVSFDCRSIGTEDMPKTIVTLTANDKNWLIDTVAQAKPFAADELERYKIPTSSLAACGGWWAGAGDYLYVIKDADTLKVFRGWQDEGQEEDSFHYEVVKKITPTDF